MDELSNHPVVNRYLTSLILGSFRLLTLDCRGMLSAAHILAMNAKNLLDVIDSVRMKHPNVNLLFNAAKNWDDGADQQANTGARHNIIPS